MSNVWLALIAGLPGILAAIGALYGIYRSNQRADRLHTETLDAAARVAVVASETKAVVDEKLTTIHGLVNSQLSESVARAETATKRVDMLEKLLISVAPHNETVKALVPQKDVPKLVT